MQIFLEYMPRVELLGHRGCVCSAFQNNVKLLSNLVVSVYIPTRSGWTCLLLHLFSNSWYYAGVT